MPRKKRTTTEDEDTTPLQPQAPMPTTRKAMVKELHDLVGQRLLTMLRDETKVIRGSTLGVMTQFLKLSADALPKDETPMEERIKADMKGRKLILFKDREGTPTEQEDALRTPFSAADAANDTEERPAGNQDDHEADDDSSPSDF